MGLFEILKRTSFKISFGLVFAFLYGLMYLKADLFFPNPETFRFYLQTSMFFFIFFLVIFLFTSKRDAEIPLFRKSFFVEGLYFLISAIITFGFLYVIGFLTKGDSLISVSEALGKINPGILMLFAFVVSFPETLIFFWIIANLIEEGLRNIKSKRLKIIIIYLLPTLAFAIYHASLGKSLLVLLFYIPLGLGFTYLKRKFGVSVSAGVHFAWDIFIIAFFWAVITFF